MTALSVALSTTAAGATEVTYTVGFTATSALSDSGGAVTVGAAAGTVFGGGVTISDRTSNASGFDSESQLSTSAGGATVTFPVPVPVAAGDQVQLVFSDVSNPAVGHPVKIGAHAYGITVTN